VHVQDEHGRPTTAGFIVKDDQDRLYPNPSKRLAPDFFFQPQVYRADGAVINLPAGHYTITVSRGPEYATETREVTISGPQDLSVALRRWINPALDDWYSGDHHIHAAGCSHYENPTEGVLPEDMWPQIDGEALNVACVLTWGPSYYYQKQFFTGRDHPLSTPDRLMHYDLEISGFPSSHAGHLVLLGLTDQDYPGATRIEDWPSWTLPVLRWAKAQGAVVGFAHSGWGLETRSADLPNYEMPAFDGIGANEYIVDVTQPDAVDFISAGDTPYVWELNIWYHTLNVGFRTRISGETDFPCITDDRVGLARSYAKVDRPLTYRKWIDAIRAGRNYVTDGRSHLMDFTVNGLELGAGDDEIRMDKPGRAEVTVRAAANLDERPHQEIRAKRYDVTPYWDLERARIGDTREVPVEIVVNGVPVASQRLLADGTTRTLTFDVALDRSSWIAARILPSSHTNPIFAVVGGKPIRASRRSAEWCLAAVNQCWSQKATQIRPAELDAARAAYDRARQVYRQRLAESER
jgi:DNA-binding transcriptional regulator YdaS (Cro superfamily)